MDQTLKLFITGKTFRGECQFLSATTGEKMVLDLSGTLEGDRFAAKTFFNGEHWSNWRGKLDVKKGTLEGSFTPVKGLPTPGTMTFARP
jgi:hypothetical protein